MFCIIFELSLSLNIIVFLSKYFSVILLVIFSEITEYSGKIPSSEIYSNIYSCAGRIVTLSVISVVLCELILKYLIESTSSPQNSTLTPVFSDTPISTIPPLMLNCPLFSTISFLSYPKSNSRFFKLFRFLFPEKLVHSNTFPTVKVITFLYNIFCGIIFCITASIVVTNTFKSLLYILFNTSILVYGKSLLSVI